MTTKFEMPDWKGKTVAVFAGGPSFNVPLAESLRDHVTIAVNHVVKLVPWVDAVVSLDANMTYWKELEVNYHGIKMCGTPSDDIDAMFIGSMYESIEVSQCHTIDIRNSGLAAIRIAAQAGASSILLVGFDPDTQAHAVGYPSASKVEDGPYPNLAAGLATVVASVRASGVKVEFAAPLPAPSGTRKRSA